MYCWDLRNSEKKFPSSLTVFCDFHGTKSGSNSKEHFLKNGKKQNAESTFGNWPEIIGSLIISLWATSSSSHYLWYRPKTRVLSELVYVLTPLRFLNTWVYKKFYRHDPFKNILTSGGVFSVWIIANGWLKTRDIEGYYGLLAYYIKIFKVTLNSKKRCEYLNTDVFRLNRQSAKLQWSDRTVLFQSNSIGHCSFVDKRRKKNQLSISSYEDLTVMKNEGWPACALVFLLPSREWRIRTPFWKQHGGKSLFPLVGRMSILTGQCFDCNKNCFQMKRRLRLGGLPAYVLFFLTE